MNVISAPAAVVHTVQTQTSTAHTFVRPIEQSYVPVLDEIPVPLGLTNGYPGMIDAARSFGHHINMTV